MKNLRYKIERKLDRYNHLMELIRTLTGLSVLILQIIILLSVTSCKTVQQTNYYKIEYWKMNPKKGTLAYEENYKNNI